MLLPLAALAGCARYAPLPLDRRPALATRVADLKLGPAPAGWPGGARAIDPHRPLDIADVALLAVDNNPDLRAARAQRGIAEAEIVAAGLLPNPQLTASMGFVVGGPGTATAWSAGLGEDIKSLVTLSAAKASARYAARKIDADLLWQEWQVVGRARLLFVDTIEARRARALLDAERRLFAARYALSERAVAEGNLPLTDSVADLAALAAVDKALETQDRDDEARRQELDALLGLAPSVTLSLAPDIALPPFDLAQIRPRVQQIPERRPDLVALALGYDAQEARLRGAILAQFPALVLGGVGGSDTTSVASVGPSVTIDLPIFNRNQGDIAIARATRSRLRAEYASRLAAAVGEAEALIARHALLERQIAAARARLPAAQSAADAADAAYRAGNLDERGYVDLAATVLGERLDIVALEERALEDEVALMTLVGDGMPLMLPSSQPPALAQAGS